MSKAAYVRAHLEHDGRHGCHWPGCDKKVPPAMWGCRHHWFSLPKPIRDEIWKTYRPGQELDKRPSAEYMKAAEAARAYIFQHYPNARHA